MRRDERPLPCPGGGLSGYAGIDEAPSPSKHPVIVDGGGVRPASLAAGDHPLQGNVPAHPRQGRGRPRLAERLLPYPRWFEGCRKRWRSLPRRSGVPRSG